MLRSRVSSVVARWAFGFALATAALPGTSHAQTASEIAAAKQWFAEGKKLEDAGDWAGALERFRRAGSVKQTPQILFHQGLCEKNTGALVEATVSLSRAVDMARAAGNKQVEQSAADMLADIRPRVPSLRIVAAEGGAPTRVLLDGAVLSEAMLGQAMPVNPGSREVVAEFPGGQFKKAVQLAEGQTETVKLEAPAAATPPPPPSALPGREEAPPPATPAAPPAPPQTPPTADTGTGDPSVVPWVLVGGGVVAAAGGVVFWLKRNGEIDDLDAICPQRDACPASRESEVDDAKSRGTTYSALGLGLMGIGVASLATGTYLLLGSSESGTQAALVPAGGPGSAGASVIGRF
jgi:hypothetical protein